MHIRQTVTLLSLFFISLICRAETGVTATSITLGQSAALSGPAKELGEGMRDGAQAYFDHVNAQGGIHGRKILLKTLDDGYEGERAAANTKQLIEQERVFALFGYVGTPTSIASMPEINREQVPFFAPFTGAQSLREPLNHDIFHIRASYFEETEKIIQQLTTLSFKRIAVFYQNDAYGKTGLDGVIRALKKHNLEVIGTGIVERNSTDVTDAVKKISQSNPQAVVMISAYTSCAAFIKAMKAQGMQPLFWNISFVGSEALARELGPDGVGVQISQVMVAPWDDINPVVKEYKHFFVKPGKPEGYVSLEGFVAAKVLVEGLRRAGPNLTREGLIKALESMSAYDAGGFVVSFSPHQHAGSDYVDLTIISKSGKFRH